MGVNRSFQFVVAMTILGGGVWSWWRDYHERPEAQANLACPVGTIEQVEAESRSLTYARYDGFADAYIIDSELLTPAQLQATFGVTIAGEPQPECVWYVLLGGSKSLHKSFPLTPTPPPSISNTAKRLVLVFDAVSLDTRMIQYSTTSISSPVPAGPMPTLPTLPFPPNAFPPVPTPTWPSE